MMDGLTKAKEPFRFYTRLNLSELTGLKASTADELLELIRTVSGSSIYHHTHRFLQQHQYLSPEPPNDFAYWASNVLGEPELGEKLASIDIIQFSTIRNLRDKIAEAIETYLQDNPAVLTKSAQGRRVSFHRVRQFCPADKLYRRRLAAIGRCSEKNNHRLHLFSYIRSPAEA